MPSYLVSQSPGDGHSGWSQIVTTANAAAAMRTSKPCPSWHFRAALSALPLLHRNCPLSQTPPQTGVPSRGHLHLLALFPRPSLSGGPSQSRSPLCPKKDQLEAEMLKPEPLRHRHPKVMLLLWGLGWELRQDQQKPAGKPF